MPLTRAGLSSIILIGTLSEYLGTSVLSSWSVDSVSLSILDIETKDATSFAATYEVAEKSA